MKIAHLILTYTNPKLTERMIERLANPNFDFYIHVDKKFSIKPYLYLQQRANVFLIHNREDVKWAGYNTIKATFKCIKEITSTGIKYDYINFLSGQDYPLKSASYMLDFFIKNQGKNFIEYQSIETEWIEAQTRINRYHFTNFTFKGRYFIERLLNSFTPKRVLPDNLKPYGKSMFWMLTAESANFVVEYVEKRPHLVHFFAFTWGSDEFVFQTILMNSHFKDTLVNNDYRYIDWSQGGSHPKILGIEDLEKLKITDDLFARKFSKDANSNLLDEIDKLITD